MMKRVLLFVALLVCVVVPSLSGQVRFGLRTFTGEPAAGGSFAKDCTVEAPDGNDSTVQDMLTNATAGASAANPNVYCIPAGEWSWDEQVIWDAPNHTVLLGQGSLSARGGPEETVIIDNFASDTGILQITTSAGSTFRMAGIRFEGGSTPTGHKLNGTIVLSPEETAAVRIDHITYDSSGYTNLSGGSLPMKFFGCPHNLVIDSSEFYTTGIYQTFSGGCNTDGEGHEVWSQATGFGGPDFLFVEDTLVQSPQAGGSVNDCYQAGRAVVRFNELKDVGATQTHPTGGSGGARGCRAMEGYGNRMTTPIGTNFNAFWLSSGPALHFDNDLSGASFDNVFTLHSMRRNNSTYPQWATPNDGWGFCGPNPTATGTVNVAANGTSVTWASGNTFNTSTWAAGDMIIIVDGATTWRAPISSVSSTTALTLSAQLTSLEASWGGAISGKTYYVGSGYDGNNWGGSGYACLDQPGRGQGDVVSRPTATWPNQALEGVYEWNNTAPTFTWWIGGVTSSQLYENQDYFNYHGNTSCNPGAGSCSAGVGRGTRAQRPASCTTGVAWWSTDGGTNWNTTNGGGNDGGLDKCTATNTWTNDWYVPYTYPHPHRSTLN